MTSGEVHWKLLDYGEFETFSYQSNLQQGWDLIEPAAELGFGDMARRPRGPQAHFLEILNYLNHQFVMMNNDLNHQIQRIHSNPSEIVS